jgi:hypothetical protein
MPGGTYRLVVNRQVDQSPQAPTLEEMQAFLSERGPQDARITDLHWSSNFYIHARLVESLQQGRLILVGDAAHIHSPALGQGMNTGIQDADNLAWKLALVVKGLADPTFLESYGLERWPIERGVLSHTDFVTNLMSDTSRIKSWIRDHIGPIILANENVSRHVRELLSELSINYAGSPFVLAAKNEFALKAGERALDAILEHEGKEVRLFELLRGCGHYLLVLSDQEIDPSRLEFPAGELNVHQVRRQVGDHPGPVDSRGQLAANYGWDCAYLIRPDGYIGASIAPSDINMALSQYLEKIRSQPNLIRPKASVI